MPESLDFLGMRGRTVLVTGASSGIGRATAVAAARAGASVVAVARRADELERLVSELDGTRHLAVPFDVTDFAGIPAMLRDVVDRVGPIDGVVHAAGIHEAAPLRVVSAERIAHLFEVNVTTAVMLAKGVRHAKVRGPAVSIVFLSSAVGIVGEAGVSVYAATKAAVASLAKSLGLELAREGVRVNAVAAGVVQSAMTDTLRETVGEAGWAEIEKAHPLGIGRVEDVADAALFLLSPASRWITGSTLVVDGGYTAR